MGEPKIPKLYDPDRPYKAHEGDWGHLPQEPCRFCREQGGVYFLIDEGPEGRDGQQVQRCDRCKRFWQADSSSA